MVDYVEPLVLEPEDGEDADQIGPLIWNYYKILCVQSKKGGAKNVTCTFCDTNFTGCSSTRALAHILGRPVLGQKRTNIRICKPIRKDNDNRYAQFKAAQKVLDNDVTAKERKLSSSKTKQSVLDLTSTGKRTFTGDIKIVESKTLDTVIANVFYENALPFNVADSSSFAVMVEQCIKFGQEHPGRKYKAPNRRRIGGARWCTPEFHSHDHTACPEALADLFTMCDKIHGAGSAGSAKAQLDWQCYYKAKKGAMFARDTTWTNASQMGPEEWYEM